MAMYSVRGFSAATAATVNHCVANLWHPAGTGIRLRVHEVCIFRASLVGSAIQPLRTTARGTAGSTVTPDADNAWEADDVPLSGVLLDLAAYSAQPTFDATTFAYTMRMTTTTGTEGNGGAWLFPGGLVILPGTGFGIRTSVAETAGPFEVTFVWEESAA